MTFDLWRQKADQLRPEGRAFIDGAYCDALRGAVFTRHSPIDGRVVGDVARCDAADVDRAVSAARAAYEAGDWRFAPPAEKKRVLQRFAALITEHAEELALLESLEVGKPISDTLSVDVPGCAGAIAYYAEAADKIYDEVAPTGPADQAVIRRMPLGVVGVVTPWNYPLIIDGWKIGPALLAGNSVVLKPAEYASLGALLLARLGHEAGLPDGVLNVVPGFGQEAGQALASHMDVDMLAFTGSTATGKRIMASAAASNLKRVALELGGKSPQIVLDDCLDLDAAAEAIAWSIFYNAGQTCHAGSRLVVDRRIARDLYARIRAVAETITPGHPLDPATRLGALADPKQLDRVALYLELAKAEDGHFFMGGTCEPVVVGGSYVQPTLVTGLSADSRCATEEIFGPVLVSLEVDGADEALKVAQMGGYGLAASVWTGCAATAHHFSEQLAAGTVWVNTYDQASMATPFGGFKQSGFGRDRSLHALEKYCDLKTVWTHYPERRS